MSGEMLKHHSCTCTKESPFETFTTFNFKFFVFWSVLNDHPKQNSEITDKNFFLVPSATHPDVNEAVSKNWKNVF